MGLFNSYLKEGKGVEKRTVRPVRPLYFFELFFRKFGKMIKLNLLYLLVTLPVWVVVLLYLLNDIMLTEPTIGFIGEFIGSVGLVFIIFSPVIGPATAGASHLFRCFATETPVFLCAEFFDHFKKNFKQATLLTLLHGILILSFANTVVYGNTPLLFFGDSTTLSVLQIPLLVVNIIFIFVSYYAYTMMVMFRLKFSRILKNSLIFAMAKLPLNIFIFILVCVLSYFSFYKLFIGVFILLLITYALCGFLVVFSIYPTLEKHMLIPAQKTAEENNN